MIFVDTSQIIEYDKKKIKSNHDKCIKYVKYVNIT